MRRHAQVHAVKLFLVQHLLETQVAGLRGQVQFSGLADVAANAGRYLGDLIGVLVTDCHHLDVVNALVDGKVLLAHKAHTH